MAVEIWYQAQIGDETISSYTHKWVAGFGNMMSSDSDNEYMFQTGAYASGSGNLYGFSRINSQQDSIAISVGYRAIIKEVKNDLLEHKVVPGISGSVEFGERIIPLADVDLLDECQNGDEVYFQIDNVQLEINGLETADDTENSLSMLFHLSHHRNYSDDLEGKNLAMFGLLRGNAGPILAKFKSQGIDIDTPLKDMITAKQFYVTSGDVMSEPIVIETVGVIEGGEILSAA
ncbi:heme acquisition protein HasA [Yersinia hibernica]|uniref:Preprotein translocase subunit SecG n=1 Tax=Yersinia hibernica TaxID=2339259 RepID=A0ABX5QVL8_9GAMM|nr:heme acquisition protein HasA [Yersinia hibernica]QAX77220.1 preprotein translocase subunit SecG [Yersinia hibernica]